MENSIKAKPVTLVEGNYLVGFHDCDPWSSNGRDFLCLQVDSMVDIPSTDSVANVVLINPDNGVVHRVGETSCWNFPQGGRQAWIRGPQEYIVFNVLEGGRFIGKLVDTAGNLIRYLEQPHYTVSRCQRFSYGLNYERMYRLGGYGYAGVVDKTAGVNAPEDDGLWKTELATGISKLILSIDMVTSLAGAAPVLSDTDHYITHILPSPDGSKLCFLHRYWLPDGGIQTRLIVCSSEGENAEVWDEGFLSHFDWIDNDSVLIWGKPASKAQALRSSSVLHRIPGASSLLQRAKPLLRCLLGKRLVPSGYYKRVSSVSKFTSDKFSDLLPIGDGHPSFFPGNRDLLLTDTYPDSSGMRELLVVDAKQAMRFDLCHFVQSDAAPSERNLESVLEFVDAGVLQKFSKSHFVYSRSGVHCDFHPRWNSRKLMFSFDSNHEGHRNVYIIDLNGVVSFE